MIMLDETDWLSYPKSKPDSTGAKYYDVVLKDGSLDVACWWAEGWYCYPEPYKIVGFRKEAIELKTYAY